MREIAFETLPDMLRVALWVKQLHFQRIQKGKNWNLDDSWETDCFLTKLLGKSWWSQLLLTFPPWRPPCHLEWLENNSGPSEDPDYLAIKEITERIRGAWNYEKNGHTAGIIARLTNLEGQKDPNSCSVWYDQLAALRTD